MGIGDTHLVEAIILLCDTCKKNKIWRGTNIESKREWTIGKTWTLLFDIFIPKPKEEEQYIQLAKYTDVANHSICTEVGFWETQLSDSKAAFVSLSAHETMYPMILSKFYGEQWCMIKDYGVKYQAQIKKIIAKWMIDLTKSEEFTNLNGKACLEY